MRDHGGFRSSELAMAKNNFIFLMIKCLFVAIKYNKYNLIFKILVYGMQ